MATTTWPPWTLLLVLGSSGVGKTLAAQQLGLRLGLPWLQVDDLRLALQRSRATLPATDGTAALYFFLDKPKVWRQQPERLRDALIAVGRVLSPAIEVVIENHIATAAPLILEGDGIVPSLLVRPPVREHVASGRVRAVCLVEPDEAALFANMAARGRGFTEWSPSEQRTQARAAWLYGHWLATEARRHGLPVLEPRPWETLVERIARACH